MNTDRLDHRFLRSGERQSPFANLSAGPPRLIAGPCSAESEAQVWAAAEAVSRAGGTGLRAGVWKPRTDPKTFQGAGPPALAWVSEAARHFDLIPVVEARDVANVPLLRRAAWHREPIIQVGSRNAQNFELLRAVGATFAQVLVKRGMAMTVEEWFLAAEYAAREGAEVMMCERGIRSFDPSTRNCLDVGAIALAAHFARWPVCADPSHATGRSSLVRPAALAAVAAGAGWIMVEAHPRPEESVTDAEQALHLDDLAPLKCAMDAVWTALGGPLPRLSAW